MSQPSLSLVLAGQAPIPLVTWIAHTEGSQLTAIEVIPVGPDGTNLLAANVGVQFIGGNQVIATAGGHAVATIVSPTATVLSGPPPGFPVSQPQPGQQPAAYLQFGVAGA